MTPESRNLTKQLLEDIIKKNKKYDMDELQEYAREIEDEYGEDAEDFLNAVEEMTTYYIDFFDHEGNLDYHMIGEFLTSYGY